MAVRARRRAAVALGLVGAGCAVLGLALVLAVPGIVRDQVEKNVRIDPSSISFNMWKDLPIPFYFAVHFFEVVNPTEVVNGAKPVVAERGPYVYREYRFKTNITFHDNDTVSFLEYRRFYFQPDMSNGKEEDHVVVPNILLLGGAVMMENLPGFLKVLISSALSGLKQTPFVNRTVGEILWGYDDPLLTILNTLVPGLIPFKGKFGLFTDFNNSNTGLFTVYTGVKDMHKIHMVDTWNGIRKTNYWRSEQCNMINGTSGEMWPPFMTPSTSLEFYSPDACRSMALVYEQPGEFKGIPTFRYVAPKTLFANGTDYPPNEGFCPCRESGIQNVSSCRLNAPVFISHPHFYNADPVLVEAVGGLHPTKEKHGLFLDIHPMTGIPMNCSIKLQMNMFMKRVSGITQTGRIKPVILPIIWFSESGSLEGPILKEFYTNLVLIPSVLEYVQYISIALGTALMIAAILLIISQQKEARKRSPKEQGLPNGSPQYSETSPLLQDTNTQNQTETAKA
ncbi:scavenger receptor class B member 1 isoform X1 [Alligator mississippiensis]|uniref:scavenger receptor class B member 1 isoform X1 n=1 Tax=Alligator mississippiensis TaxID=8496 RepID=UPI0006ECA785|nr:scavenger receptor class B member 1 isoform X1 [Alligator mississippiensis]